MSSGQRNHDENNIVLARRELSQDLKSVTFQPAGCFPLPKRQWLRLMKASRLRRPNAAGARLSCGAAVTTQPLACRRLNGKVQTQVRPNGQLEASASDTAGRGSELRLLQLSEF